MELFVNHEVQKTPLAAKDRSIFGTEAPDIARPITNLLCGREQTPLLQLPDLARRLGIGNLFYKDESQRGAIKSFKALGGGYGVALYFKECAEQKLGRPVSPEEIFSMTAKDVGLSLTIATASEGNHGQSVAHAASLFGIDCIIFLRGDVSQAREDAIAKFGAKIIRTPGVYDDAAAEAIRQAQLNGWKIISDTAVVADDNDCLAIMQGYVVLMAEINDQLGKLDNAPTHIFVQGGCGGFAAPIAGFARDCWLDKTKTIVVEPEVAPCIMKSVAAGGITKIAATVPTIVTMLDVYEVSAAAFPILQTSADAFLTISDEVALRAREILCEPAGGDPIANTSTSGAAGLAGLMVAASNEEWRKSVGLGEGASVLVIGTEGAADQE